MSGPHNTTQLPGETCQTCEHFGDHCGGLPRGWCQSYQPMISARTVASFKILVLAIAGLIACVAGARVWQILTN